MSIFGKHRITTFQIIAFGFFIVILIGTLLLMLPISSVHPGGAGFADCLFTATSAVCVTGLVVQDTATYWSPFGQAVILLLIQIGGMGVVTAAVSLAFVSGRRIGLMQRSVMQESISAPQVGGIVRLTRFIVLTALGIEAAGAVLLLPAFTPEFGLGKGAWYAVFHSVSAFCNAGFDLMGIRGAFSSLTGYAQHILVNVVLILLITVGGIGFLVWKDISTKKLHFKTYTLQTKIVLTTTLLLIILPAIYFSFFEYSNQPVGDGVINSLF
ncbi:MAG: Trk family potassium uptake protein, partial [Clostridia bacterium]|nr:Trk family potassium uptake protein [Clostridia bacterium]